MNMMYRVLNLIMLLNPIQTENNNTVGNSLFAISAQILVCIYIVLLQPFKKVYRFLCISHSMIKFNSVTQWHNLTKIILATSTIKRWHCVQFSFVKPCILIYLILKTSRSI